MTTVQTPYRFVPLSRLILLPDWASKASHDHPFQDAVSGELTIRLTCHTPLCVGGMQTASTGTSPGRVEVFHTPSGEPAIPGSALKGMVRNVLDIAAFARFRQVEDQKLGVRDISSADTFYVDEIIRTPVQTGWLTFTEGKWQVKSCRFSRIHQQDVFKAAKIPSEIWKKCKTAKDRYQKIGLLPRVRFTLENHPQLNHIAKPVSDGVLTGAIVVTGQPGRAWDDGTKSKKYEFVFHDPMPGEHPPHQIEVEDVVMRGFRHIHRESEEWAFWQEKLTAGELDRGIPVFFHANGTKVRSLGLAMMYKLPFKHSVHEAIGHTSPAHMKDDQPDLGDLLFGRIDNEEGSLRGRVGFTLATPAFGQEIKPYFLKPTVLASPKPSFYPAYMRQDRMDFRQLMQPDSELAGWKRYPPKPFDGVPPLPEKSKPTAQVSLQVVPEESEFTGCIRVHNLRRVELGALLWALDFGDHEKYRHGLGMGKPLGLGQVSLQLTDWQLEPNDPCSVEDGNIDRAWIDACRQEFMDLMDQTLHAAGCGPWASSGPIQALLEHATPAQDGRALEYLPLTSFNNLRKKAALPEIKDVLHGHAGVVPARGYDTNIPRGWTSRFNENLIAGRKAMERVEHAKQHQANLTQATSGERRILELQRLLTDIEGGIGGKTTVHKLNDVLREAAESRDDFSVDEYGKLIQLIARIQLLDNKKIQKACKKFAATEQS